MLNARLNVKNALLSYGNKPECVPITKELLTLARSPNASYKSYLEKERNERERRLKPTQEYNERKKVDEEKNS